MFSYFHAIFKCFFNRVTLRYAKLIPIYENVESTLKLLRTTILRANNGERFDLCYYEVVILEDTSGVLLLRS